MQTATDDENKQQMHENRVQQKHMQLECAQQAYEEDAHRTVPPTAGKT